MVSEYKVTAGLGDVGSVKGRSEVADAIYDPIRGIHFFWGSKLTSNERG